jgi:hypothetical protein
MTSFNVLLAAGFLAAAGASPVFAQAAIQELGMFAFYYPYADVLSGGAPTPAARLALEPPAAMQAYAARESGIGRCASEKVGPQSNARPLKHEVCIS